MSKTKTVKARGRTGLLRRNAVKMAIKKWTSKGYTLTHQERGTLGATFLTFTKES